MITTSNNLPKLALITALSVIFVGCASTPKQTDPTLASQVPREKWRFKTPEAVLQDDDVKGKTPDEFNKPLAETRMAALRALSFVGCKIDRQEDYYVVGKRPHKMGFFVGSGGETVEVFLHPASPDTTQVWVDTDLSFVGIAGQQGWDKQVLQEMHNITSQPSTASSTP